MNRTAALLLALTTLLAHGLLVHQDSTGRFAPPYEAAHAAFRLARNLVFTGEATWNPGMFVMESHPSPLWVFLCAVGERFYLPVTLFAQTLGLLCALATVVLAAQFTRDRLAGVIAPMLLVVNGGVAAAGSSGTEIALLMLLVTAAFLAQEKRLPRTFAVLASLLWVVRWEGACTVFLLFAFEVMRSVRRRPPPSLLSAFLAPLAVALVVMGARWSSTGDLWSPSTYGLFAGGAPHLGLPYLTHSVLASGTPLLVVIPVAYLVRRRLVGRARRALAFALLWSGAVVWTGGDSQPFWGALVPMLPLLFLAVQDAITLAVDGRRAWVTNGWVALLFVGVATSILASKQPGKIGPLPNVPLPRTWIQPDPELTQAYERPAGRTGLVREINQTDRLRSVGVFLRDNLGPRATLLTPWPGAIGYLSRRVVIDMRGRVTPSPLGDGQGDIGTMRLAPWFGSPKTDLVAHFARRPDYVIAWIEPKRFLPGRETLARSLLTKYDLHGERPDRVADLLTELEAYELVAVPVPAHSSQPDKPSEYPAHLLRRSDLNLTPRLRLERDAGQYVVTVKHRGHFQLVDLELSVITAEGAKLYMRPTGEFVADPAIRARKRLLLYGTGARSVELLSGQLPRVYAGATLRIVLRNPGSIDPACRPIEMPGE